MASIFETLNAVNVNGRTEKKKTGNVELTYLSWPWAWAEVKSRYPEAHYTIWKDADGRPYAYDPLTGYMVYTTVHIGDESHDMWLPVMDGANNAMKAEPYDYTVKNPSFKYARWNSERNAYIDKYGNEQTEYLTKHVDACTMFDVNKTIMRCLVKNLAMFGLGLYIYAGEDLPEGETESKPAETQDIPRNGSTEAAQDVGKAKLEALKAKAPTMEVPTTAAPARARKMASEEQKEYIRSNADDATNLNAMQAFGVEFERMTEAQANKLIARIKEAV